MTESYCAKAEEVNAGLPQKCKTVLPQSMVVKNEDYPVRKRPCGTSSQSSVPSKETNKKEEQGQQKP